MVGERKLRPQQRDDREDRELGTQAALVEVGHCEGKAIPLRDGFP